MTSIKYVLIFSISICFFSQLDGQSKKPEFNILFIGNSLTYTNDLPYLVKKEAKSLGINIKYNMLAYPNYAISDHWNDGKVQKLISKKIYDFVIIQQGPSSQLEGKKLLIEYGKRYSLLCENNKAQLVYFMVWPSLQYYHTFEGVIENYQLAAELNNAILCPVGRVWKNHFDITKSFDYYSQDGFHPSKKGSEITAEVIVKSLFKQFL